MKINWLDRRISAPCPFLCLCLSEDEYKAVHVWQEWCDYYGELTPGSEQESYGIQSVAQELMAEFAKRMES